ncbi:thioredoxin-like protein [Chitinophaga dinghuensis]|uniref:Thioredoxin-like protein n=1 Tax=Chitinophaga dinghuensis TaxID=1539050 RepID=A0A327VY23_9BACT|nr:thioredoxin domain-containing protein [Chitinophaga dinghuensis]RAJ81941.1 thioredoxin-like protein [Chitinophaga dinghuensis]
MAHLKNPVTQNDHSTGNPQSGRILVEYGDYQCSHCGIAFPLIRKLLRQYGDDLLFVFRNFPLQESHPAAVIAALAAEAAALQGKFWEMHDILYENQAELSADNILGFAATLHLDMSRFSQDWRSQQLLDRVERDLEGGLRSGVNGTPTFFLNGERYNDYDETYQSLAMLMEA